MSEEKNEELFTDIAPKKSKAYLFIIAVLIIIFGVLAAIKFLILDNPARTYKSFIADAREDAISMINDFKIENALSNSTTIETNGFLFDLIGIDDLKKFKIDLNSNADLKNNNLNTNLKFNDGKSKTNIDITLTYKDGHIYLNFADAYDKTIDIKLDEESKKELDSNLSKDYIEEKEKIKYLTNKLTTLFTKSLKKEYFTKEKATINVNNKDIKVNANVLNLDSKNANNIKNEVLNGILNDPTSITYLASISSLSTDELKESIKNAINEQTANTNDYIKIYLYTTKLSNEVVGIKFETSTEGNIDYIDCYKVDEFIKLEAKETFKIEGSTARNGEVIISSYNNEEKNYTKILTLKVINLDDDEINIDYKFNSIDFLGELSGNIYYLNEDENIKFSFDIDKTEDGVTSSMKINSNTNIKDNININVDNNNLIDSSEIDIDSLLTTLLEKYKDIEIINDLTQLIEG